MENEDYKVSIEKRITCLEVKIEEILTNHLPHLSEDIKKLDDRTWWILASVILSIIIQIALKF